MLWPNLKKCVCIVKNWLNYSLCQFRLFTWLAFLRYKTWKQIGTFSDLTIVWGHTKIMHSLHSCLLTLKHVVFFFIFGAKKWNVYLCAYCQQIISLNHRKYIFTSQGDQLKSQRIYIFKIQNFVWNYDICIWGIRNKTDTSGIEKRISLVIKLSTNSCGVGTTYPSGAPEFTPGFKVGSLVLCVCFVDRYLFFCTLSFGHCVFFCDLRILITPLVSSSSYLHQCLLTDYDVHSTVICLLNKSTVFYLWLFLVICFDLLLIIQWYICFPEQISDSYIKLSIFYQK